MEIIRFNNGQYALRKKTFFSVKYLDLKSFGEHWWTKSDFYFNDCISDSIEEIKSNKNFNKFAKDEQVIEKI